MLATFRAAESWPCGRMSSQFSSEGISQSSANHWFKPSPGNIDTHLCWPYRLLDLSRICPNHFWEASGHVLWYLKTTTWGICVTMCWYHCPNCHWNPTRDKGSHNLFAGRPQHCCLCPSGCLCWPCGPHVLPRQVCPKMPNYSVPWSSHAGPPRQAGVNALCFCPNYLHP